MTAPTPPAEAPTVFAMNITPEFCAALAKFQAKLPKIEKNRLVEVATADGKDDYDYSYATLDHVSGIVLPKLAEHGLSFAAFPGTGTAGRLSLRYFLMHTSGGYIGTEWPISSEAKGMRAVQNLGGLITYVRRYALQAATGVAAEGDDDDLRAAVAAEEKPRTAQRATRGEASRGTRAAENTQRRREQARPETNPAPPTESDTEPDDTDKYRPRDPEGAPSGPQLQRLAILFGEISKTAADGDPDLNNRDIRLSVVSQLVGRRLSTAKELTAGEAHEIMNILDAALATDAPVQTLKAAAQAAATATEGEGQ